MTKPICDVKGCGRERMWTFYRFLRGNDQSPRIADACADHGHVVFDAVKQQNFKLPIEAKTP